MIKYFCDCCEAEVETKEVLSEFKYNWDRKITDDEVLANIVYNGRYGRRLFICPECYREIYGAAFLMMKKRHKGEVKI
jgi:hypothetical protein